MLWCGLGDSGFIPSFVPPQPKCSAIRRRNPIPPRTADLREHRSRHEEAHYAAMRTFGNPTFFKQDGFAALLSCRALSSPTTCRFIPALSGLPVTRARIIKKASVKQQWSISLRRVDGPIRSQAHPTIISFNRESHSSRRSIAGSTDSARCAGIHVAISPSNAIARTVPVNTMGSRGVA